MEKNNKLWLGIFIGILICLVGVFGGYIVYDKVIVKNNNSGGQIEQDNNSENENFEGVTACHDCIKEVVLPDEYEMQKTVEGKILLGNSVRNLKVAIDSDGEHGYSSVSVDNTLLKKFYFESMESIDSVYVLKNDLLMIVTNGSYIRSSKYYFYNINLQEINTNFVIDSEYPNSMKNSGDIGEKLIVKNDVITIIGSRMVSGNDIELENGKSTRLCDYEEYGIDDVNYIKGSFKEHKGEVIKAKYEIEYLGNGQFAKSKRIEVLQRVDESLCK